MRNSRLVDLLKLLLQFELVEFHQSADFVDFQHVAQAIVEQKLLHFQLDMVHDLSHRCRNALLSSCDFFLKLNFCGNVRDLVEKQRSR